jgi:anti-sigma factor RsiW
MCEWVADHLDEFLEDELGQEEARQVETHCTTCQACSEELELARHVKGTLDSLPGQECPESVVDAIFDHVGNEVVSGVESGHVKQAGKRRISIVWRYAASAAAMFIVLILAIVLFRPPTPQQEGPTSEEIAQAEQQFKLTMAYIVRVSEKSASTVKEDVIETGVVLPIRRAMTRAVESRELWSKFSKS